MWALRANGWKLWNSGPKVQRDHNKYQNRLFLFEFLFKRTRKLNKTFSTNVHDFLYIFFEIFWNKKGSSADKSDLQIGDEILEINGKSVCDYNHSQIISYIHNVSFYFLFLSCGL